MTTNFIIAQINPKVGDIAGNVQLILDAAASFADDEAAFLVFPELAMTGYPPEDLLSRPAFVAEAVAAVDTLREKSEAFKCTLLVGGVWQEGDKGECPPLAPPASGGGKILVYNAAMVIAGGEIRHIHKKNSLPNYGVFDERRYFAQGSAPVVYEHRSETLGVLICEDGWFEHNWRLLKVQGAQRALVINASPFEVGKQQQRVDYFSEMSKRYGLSLLYVNMAGAQDDLVFDGASFAMDEHGELVAQAGAFEESIVKCQKSKDNVVPYPSELESIWLAIGSGLRNYIEKNHISNVVLGLSGGIDSAMIAALAVDVLGAKRVHGVLMPSEFTSDESNKDAEQLAANLGINTSVVPIGAFMDVAEQHLIPNITALYPRFRGDDTFRNEWKSNLTIGGNLQARLRGNILMAYSNALGGVVLNTSNKSEIAVGYSTMYGDACGAYSPLKDVYKTQVYALAMWRNEQSAVIPTCIIDKAPTAELKPKQQDSDQLPEYDVLDKILHGLVEERLSVAEVAAHGFDAATVEKIYALLRGAEYKRRQFPPGPKVSPMLFGRDWRYPLTNGYKA